MSMDEDEEEEDEGEDEDDEQVGEEENEEDEDNGFDIGSPTQLPGASMDDYDDALCAVCGQGAPHEGSRGGGGRHSLIGVIACDGGCGRAFHLGCVGLRAVPVADWVCGECSAAPTASSEEEGEDEGGTRQRPSQRRRAALQVLQKRNWG